MENSPRIVKLPDLVIWLILEHLSYEDLQNLRATCKKLKVIIDQRPFRSLHLLVKGYPCEWELFYTGELVDYANTYHVSDLRLLKSIKFQSQFSELCKLTIYQTIGRKISSEIMDLNDLNCFKGLVHLQIDYVGHTENSRLSLRNLKIAKFLQFPDVPFELDCPRLEALGLGVRIQPQLTPETSNSLRHLFISFAHQSETYLMILYQKLKNLTSISFEYDSDLNSFVLALMEGRVCLPSLKKINLKNAGFFANRGVLLKNLIKMQNRHDTRHYEVLINWKMIASDQLIEMLNLLDKLIPPDRRIRDPEEVDISFFWNPLYLERIRYFTENPIFNCLLPDVSDLRLETNEEFTAGKQLIGKLRNLQFLTIGKVIKLDDQFFEHILRTCPRLCSFNIGCAFQNQQLLNRMPNYLPALECLPFRHNFSPSNLNLEFVAEFKNLIELHFDFNIDKETMNFLFKNCNHQPVLKLRFYKQDDDRDHCILSIGRKMNGQYKITRYIGESKKKMEFDCMEDAIEHYYQNDPYNYPDRSWPVSWIRCCLL